VLVTPITQRRFRDGRVPRSFPLYEDAARQVAAETRTPLIDLAAASRRWVEAAGEAGSRRFFLHLTPADAAPGFPQGIDDDTHLSELGARGAAELVARDLARLRLPIARHVRTDRRALLRTTPMGNGACG
jgi:lysophospholipase L1-like esterase